MDKRTKFRQEVYEEILELAKLGVSGSVLAKENFDVPKVQDELASCRIDDMSYKDTADFICMVIHSLISTAIWGKYHNDQL